MDVINEYLQVKALSKRIIGIYLHEFTNNEREISIPHEALLSAVLKISSSLLFTIIYLFCDAKFFLCFCNLLPFQILNIILMNNWLSV